MNLANPLISIPTALEAPEPAAIASILVDELAASASANNQTDVPADGSAK